MEEVTDMACNTNSLSEKTVVSVCDVKKLVHICKYELDLFDVRITAIFVPGESGKFGFSQSPDIRIPWDRIKKIGEDVILADVPPFVPECSCHEQGKERRRWFRW